MGRLKEFLCILPGTGLKIRSTTASKPAQFLRTAADTAQVTLAEPEYGVAAGQACVLYRGTRVLGGGWIAREH